MILMRDDLQKTSALSDILDIAVHSIHGLRESGVEAQWLSGELYSFSIIAVMAVSMHLRRVCHDRRMLASMLGSRV